MKSLIPISPQFHPLSRLREQFDNMMADWFHGGNEAHTEMAVTSWRPRMDVAETDGAFEFTVEIPGVKAEDVEISVTDNALTVKGERQEEKETKDKTYHRVERSYGSFYRSMALPTGCDAEKIEATSEDGVIKITIQKSEEQKAKTIKVKAK